MDAATQRDVATVGRITAVPKILQAVSQITGLRFAAVARVTDTSWTACQVHDELAFGLLPGGELPLETTLCNEIRLHREPIEASMQRSASRMRELIDDHREVDA